MTRAVDAMHPGDICIGQSQSLLVATRLMPISKSVRCRSAGDDDRLHGIITDRDSVVKCIAEGHDPSVITGLGTGAKASPHALTLLPASSTCSN